jgi:hypothetical protein
MSGDERHVFPFPIDHNLPYGWRHPVTGRRSNELDPLLVQAGAHHRRARYMARKTQDSLGREALVTQSQISRFERALAPSMDAEKLVRLSRELHPHFPIGYCPHDHYCPWQRIPMPMLPVGVGPPNEPDFARLHALLDDLGRRLGTREAAAPEPAEDPAPTEDDGSLDVHE